MAIPIYVLCKAKGNSISDIGSEIPKREGHQVLEGNIHCQYEKIGGVFHYHFKIDGENLYMGKESLYFKDRKVEIQINVRSHEGRKTPKLEYLFIDNLKIKDEEKFSLKKLEQLDYGIKLLNCGEENKKEGMALDYIRSNLFNIGEFKSVPTTIDLNEELHKYIMDAKEEDADLYIFGDLYPMECRTDFTLEEKFNLLREKGPKGIHDIHMNQGNCDEEKWKKDEGIYQDGGIFIHFKDDSWSAIFMKFESQKITAELVEQ